MKSLPTRAMRYDYAESEGGMDALVKAFDEGIHLHAVHGRTVTCKQITGQQYKINFGLIFLHYTMFGHDATDRDIAVYHAIQQTIR